MSLPDDIDALFATEPPVPPFPELFFAGNHRWKSQACIHVNSCLFRVSRAGRLLRTEDQHLYPVLRSTINKKRKYVTLREAAWKRIPPGWFEGDFQPLGELIRDDKADLGSAQIYSALKGEAQLLAKALMSIVTIDTFLQTHGVNTPVHHQVKIRPCIYTVPHFDEDFLKKNIRCDKQLFRGLKHVTGQIDGTGLVRMSRGSRFFKDLARKKPCSIITASGVALFLKETGLCDEWAKIEQREINHKLRPARGER